MSSLISLVVLGAVLLIVLLGALCLIAFSLATSKKKPVDSKPLDELLDREAHEIKLDAALNEHVTVVDRIQKRRAANTPQ